MLLHSFYSLSLQDVLYAFYVSFILFYMIHILCALFLYCFHFYALRQNGWWNLNWYLWGFSRSVLRCWLLLFFENLHFAALKYNPFCNVHPKLQLLTRILKLPNNCTWSLWLRFGLLWSRKWAIKCNFNGQVLMMHGHSIIFG